MGAISVTRTAVLGTVRQIGSSDSVKNVSLRVLPGKRRSPGPPTLLSSAGNIVDSGITATITNDSDSDNDSDKKPSK